MVTRHVGWALPVVAAIAMAPAPARAQGTPATVTGQVRDVTTSTPVAGATVAIPALRRTVTADSLGEFRMERVPVGTHRWVIVALGYVVLNEEMAVVDGDRFTIGIMPSPVPVEGVTVNAQTVERYFARRASVSGGSMELYTTADLLATGLGNIEQAVIVRAGLRSCPVLGTGVYSGTFAEGASTLLCVLKRGRYVPIGTIYIDGRPAMGGMLELSAIPPEALYAVEVWGGGTRIYAYTKRFAERLARGRERIPNDSPVN